MPLYRRRRLQRSGIISAFPRRSTRCATPLRTVAAIDRRPSATDPIKRIADPENLQSPNKAIRTAAEVKADQDLAPQKIKAIKYLATVGCGCYKPEVKEALLEALDDCTEAVRYEAAIAFCKAAGNPCNNCDENGCCSAVVMQKLHDIAQGQDENCCYKESSARVRAAAEMALNACRRKVGPTQEPGTTPVTVPEGRGRETLTPTEAPPMTPTPEKELSPPDEKLPKPPAPSLQPPEKKPSVTIQILPSPPSDESRDASAVVQTSALMRIEVQPANNGQSR